MMNEFEDATIVAYLAYRGHTATAVQNTNGRIVFEVEGDITKDIEAFHTNYQVGILDYVRTLKMIKSQIFTMKAIKRNKRLTDNEH